MTEFGPVPPGDELPDMPVEAPEPPPRVRTTSTRRPAKGRESQGRKTAPKRKAPPPPEPPSPADAIRGILQLPAAALIITGQRLESVPIVADGATILVHGPQVAEAIEELARNDPRVMALLEKVLAFGPYGALLAALFPFVAQLVRNHNEEAAPILGGFGAVSAPAIINAASLEIPTAQVSPNGQGSQDGAETTN